MRAENIKFELYQFVKDTEIGADVVKYLIPEGTPLSFETELWDFKRKPPILGEKPDDKARETHKFETHELIKDIISFHNSYGGYIIFGVEDAGDNRIVGCDLTLDLGDISKRIKSHTEKNIELFQNAFDVGQQKVLVLLIPKRGISEEPVVFRKQGPSSSDRKPAYQKNSVYIRIRDESRPAENSAEDWKFLNSERTLSATVQNHRKESIPSNLPPRDPDMVQFVGRDKELASLRSWVLDKRSPVKLISGIGGLGKTSVAYHFCEELADAMAGEFEFIAWVSAKKTTYAALRGDMVKTTRHDFSTVRDLLQRLITLLAGESSIENDIDEDEYVDILVDALTYKPSFIVVDDLDSLSPEEQRACATVLQEVGFRTVDRDHASSKFLMTSRLDQGLSPTSVVKIAGLDELAFNDHINNLCDQFELQRFQSRLLKQIFSTSSGSPLFASAIVRMAHLGEKTKEICEKWASNDGEDVREFAFKRELERLSTGGASVLLVTLKLGEVSLAELLDALEISSKSLSDHVNELHSFHLLSKKENNQGDIVLSTSNELVASAGILKKKLGQKAHEIERRCAVIRKNQGNATKEVGRSIRKILQCLDDGEPDQAMVLATELSQRNPQNGDTWCILARAYLSVKPPKHQKADEACSNAMKYSCVRNELFDYVIESKIGISDWKGLKSFTDGKRSRSTTKDPILDAYLLSVNKLIGLANDRGDYREAVEHAKHGIIKISEKIQHRSLAPDLFTALMHEQNHLADVAIKYRKISVERPRDNLSVADLGFELIDLNIKTRGVVSSICEGLTKWSDAVKSKEVLDEAEADILANNTRKLNRLSSLIQACKRDIRRDIEMIDATQRQLGFVGASFS